MAYKNDVHNTYYFTTEYYDILTCFIKTVTVHIKNLNYELWTIFKTVKVQFDMEFYDKHFYIQYVYTNPFKIVHGFLENLIVH